jgi:hypothetical protein
MTTVPKIGELTIQTFPDTATPEEIFVDIPYVPPRMDTPTPKKWS